MCYGAESLYIGAALAAAGAATSGYAQSQQLKKQDSIAAQGIVKQGQLNNQANNDVKQNVATVAQSNAKTQAASAAQLASYQKALQAGTAQTSAADPNIAGSSKAYKAEQTQSKASAQDYVNAIANSAATTNGTQLERVGENQDMGQTAQNLSDLTRQSNEQSYVTKLQIQATKANPWLSGLGTALSTAGSVTGIGAGINAAGAAQRAGAANNALSTGYLSGTTPYVADQGTLSMPDISGSNPWG
jgi:hypothetical protein